MEFPDPVIEQAVEPKTKADQEKMSIALHLLVKKVMMVLIQLKPITQLLIVKHHSVSPHGECKLDQVTIVITSLMMMSSFIVPLIVPLTSPQDLKMKCYLISPINK